MASSEEFSNSATGELVAGTARPWWRPAVMIPTGLVLALIAGFLPSFSWSANVLSIGVGGSLFWLGVTERVPPAAEPLRRLPSGSWAWLIPGAGFAVIESINYVYGTFLRAEYAHPTLSLMADPLLEAYLPRALLFGAWLAAFWGMVRR